MNKQAIVARIVKSGSGVSPLAQIRDDLELSPFNQRDGLGKAYQLFGDQLPKLLDEINEVLAA